MIHKNQTIVMFMLASLIILYIWLSVITDNLTLITTIITHTCNQVKRRVGGWRALLEIHLWFKHYVINIKSDRVNSIQYIYRRLSLHECKIIMIISNNYFEETITLNCEVSPDVERRCMHGHDTHAHIRGMSVVRASICIERQVWCHNTAL